MKTFYPLKYQALWVSSCESSWEYRLRKLLQFSLAAEFIGHGAFGIIGKAAWVPYFSMVGLEGPEVYLLMGVIGMVDILLGLSALVSPRRIIFLYMGFWGFLTALMRPLAGQGWWEFFERSYNFGMPLLCLYLYGKGGTWLREASFPTGMNWIKARRFAFGLRLMMALFLIGHGGLGAFDMKAGHLYLYAGIGLTPWMEYVGWFEILLGIAVLMMNPLTPGVAWGVFIWKVLTESLFLWAGVPWGIFEFIERGGSYAAPLAYLILLKIIQRESQDRFSFGHSGVA